MPLPEPQPIKTLLLFGFWLNASGLWWGLAAQHPALPSSAQDTRISQLITKGADLRNQNLDSARQILHQAIALAYQHPSAQHLLDDAYRELGINYFYSEKYDSAHWSYDQGLIYAKQYKDSAKISSLLFNKARVLVRQNKSLEALDLFRKAYEIDRKINDYYGMGYDLNQIATLYSYLRDYILSDSLFRLSIHYRKLSSDTLGMGYTVLNFGLHYLQKKEYDSAAVYSSQAIRIFEKYEDPFNLVAALINYGNALIMTGDYEKVAPAYQKAINIASNHQMNEDLILLYTNLGHLKIKQKAIDSAIVLGYKAEKIMTNNKVESLEIKRDLYRLFYTAFDKKNDLEKTLFYLKKLRKVDAAFQESISLDRFKKLEKKYIQEKNEIRLKAADREKELYAKKSQNLFIYTTILVGALLIIIILAIMLWSTSRRSMDILQKKNKEIEASYQSIFSINENLSELVIDRTRDLEKQKENLEAQNTRLQNFAFMNAHKMRGPICRVLGLLNVYEISQDQMSADELIALIKQLVEEMEEVTQSIAHQLNEDPNLNELPDISEEQQNQ